MESLSHVLQGCPVTHFERIRRYDEIVKKVARHSRRRGWTVEVEPRVYHPDRQLYKPDLVIHQPRGLTVVDVQVCWEGPRHALSEVLYTTTQGSGRQLPEGGRTRSCSSFHY